MRRRTLLKRAGSVGVAASTMGVASKGPEPLRVGFFVSDDVRAAEPINYASRAAQRHLSPLTEKTLRVGPEGVVEAPQTETIAEMAKWWSMTERRFDVNFLCVGTRPWEYLGYALPPSHAVVSHTSALIQSYLEWIILHEVAHCFGARHHHGDGTIMEKHYGDVERMEYSTQTKRKLRGAL